MGGKYSYSALHFGSSYRDRCQEFDVSKYDDVIEMKTEEMPKYLDFPGSQLTPIVRIKISYFKDTRHNQFGPAIPYEDLWYYDGKPLGSKHYGALNIHQTDTIGVLVRQRLGHDLSLAEASATADATIRILLDATLNRNIIATVNVPATSFLEIINSLQTHHFKRYRDVISRLPGLIAIELESTVGTREVLRYVGSAE